jgi:predicted nucleic acid-binding protein
VLIAHLRGVPAAQRWLIAAREANGPLSISVVTVMEITGGMRAAEKRSVWRLLDAMNVEDVNETVARRAGALMREYRRSHTAIGLAEFLIGATADVRGLDLATLNVGHYPMFKGLRPPFKVPRLT